MELEQCQLMDSTFLGVLAGAGARFRQSTCGKHNIELSNSNARVAGLIESLGVASLFTPRVGELELPPDVHARRLALDHATKIELKETSLAAHEQLMRLNEANKMKFAELARTLRQDLESLRAGEPPALPGFDMAARNRQAGPLGGDFYDFAPRAGLRLGVLIADVSGKGASAAQIASQCRPLLHQQLAMERSPAAVLKEALPRVVAGMPENMFVTALCIVLDSVTRSFRVARAGHDPLLWFRAETQTVELLSPKGMALGIERTGLLEATFVERELKLAPGDVLLLHSDGITEELDPAGAEFGCERLADLLKTSAALDARSIVEKIFAAVQEFTHGAPPLDDQTVVVVKSV
jgi:serine phosphatase RsbU (regulator of sigma subunit)